MRVLRVDRPPRPLQPLPDDRGGTLTPIAALAIIVGAGVVGGWLGK